MMFMPPAHLIVADTAGMVTDCQGYGRYAVPCRRRVRVSPSGRALCAAHRSQDVAPLTREQTVNPRTRPGRL